MARANLLSLFRQFPKLGGDTAVVETRGYRRRRVTYSELHTQAISLSNLLAAQGVSSGDRVLLWGVNSSDWMASFWAILLRGAVVVPMDAGASREFVERVVREAQVKLIVRDSAQPDFAIGQPSLVYSLQPAGSAAASATAEPSVEPARSDVAEILFTSGTTSEPRGVVLTHGNFLANLEPLEQSINEYRSYERWVHPLRFVSTVPLSHVFGQFMALFIPCFLGAAIVFENSALPTEILRSIKQERATIVVAVPRMLDALRNGLEREIDSRGWRKWFNSAYAAAKDEWFWFRPWRFRRFHWLLGWKFWAFISGGASLSTDTEDFFKRIGYAVVQGYGMTETASLISLNDPFHAAEGSVGKVLPGREFRLGSDGEILVRGENVSRGYWEKGALCPVGQGSEGWLHTGDLGEIDAEGNLRFRGRKKNVIVTPAGLNVYPEDLEAALRRQPAIRDAVVVPVQISGNAEPCAVLVLQHAASQNGEPQFAVDAANTSLAEYQRIRRWLLWPEPDFPRTPTGKPRLSLISSRAATMLNASGNAIPSEARDRLSSFASPTSFPADIALKDLASLDRIELLSSLEHRYNVELNETQFANAKSVAEIQQLLLQPSAQRTDFAYPVWAQRAPVRLFRLLIYYALSWPATLLLAHPRVIGRENLASLKGPVLIVCNHTTRRADIGLILYALPARFRGRLATAMGGENLRSFRHPPDDWFFAKRWLCRSAISCWSLYSMFSRFRNSPAFAKVFGSPENPSTAATACWCFPRALSTIATVPAWRLFSLVSVSWRKI